VEEGDVICSILAAKTHIAPIKPQLSIPRLELQGAVLAVRLADSIERELYLPSLEKQFWTDSTTVLAYVKNENRRFKPFVANRVSEIRELSKAEQWRYVNTSMNIACVE
jgi:hypothetical protein